MPFSPVQIATVEVGWKIIELTRRSELHEENDKILSILSNITQNSISPSFKILFFLLCDFDVNYHEYDKEYGGDASKRFPFIKNGKVGSPGLEAGACPMQFAFSGEQI
uniref:CSON012146 protein n=1 Tax=Culicoides sonorensis TaxID=179676 RepID=A0A336MGS1_CULSO